MFVVLIGSWFILVTSVLTAGTRSRHGSALSSRDGSALSSRDGSALSSRDGSALSSRDGSALSSRDGSALSSRDGNALSSRDGSALSSRGHTETPPDRALKSRPRADVSPKDVIPSDASGFPNETVFKNARPLVGNPESGYEPNQGSYGSRNSSRTCACHQNKQIGNTVESIETCVCPCRVPVSQNTQGPDNGNLLYDRDEFPDLHSMKDVKRLKAWYDTLSGVHSLPRANQTMKHESYREKQSLVRLPRSTLNLDREDRRMAEGYDIAEGSQEGADLQDAGYEAALIRGLGGERLDLEGGDNSGVHLPYNQEDFHEYHPDDVFREKIGENLISIKYLNPTLNGAEDRAAYFDVPDSRLSPTYRRHSSNKVKSSPFSETRPGGRQGASRHHTADKRASVSALDVTSMRQVSGDTCRLKLIDHIIVVPGCAVRFVTVTTCHGSCHSSTYPRWRMIQAEHLESCTCCGIAAVEPRVFRLQCLRKPNHEFYVRIDNPVKCICRPCDSVPEVGPEKPYN